MNNAVELLTEQHREIDRLFERLASAKRGVEREKSFTELAAHLVAHDAVEREIFYPCCERVLGRSEPLVEGLVEHGLIQFTLLRADQARGTDSFDYLVSVLEEIVVHHVEEEEAELLSDAARAMGSDMLDALGRSMQARFASAMARDYRKQLREEVEVALGVRKRPGRRTTSIRRKAIRSVASSKRGTPRPKRVGRVTG